MTTPCWRRRLPRRPPRRRLTRRQLPQRLDYRSEEHTSELQSRRDLVCRLLLEKKNLHTKRQNLFQELDAVIHLLMEAKHWGLRKSRNATSLNSRFKSLDTLKVKIISVTFRRVIRTNHKKASKIFFFNDTPTTEIYTLSLHDALPI